MKREHWEALAKGWTPFPFQVSGWRSAEKDGRIKVETEDVPITLGKVRTVLILTDRGRAWMKSKGWTA